MKSEKVHTFTGSELAEMACAKLGLIGRVKVEFVAPGGAYDINQIQMRISYED